MVQVSLVRFTYKSVFLPEDISRLEQETPPVYYCRLSRGRCRTSFSQANFSSSSGGTPRRS